MRAALQSCVAVMAMAATVLGQDKMPWQPNLETAQRVAAETNRLVLIHFWAPWCRPCVRLEREVFSRAETAKALEANFVMVKLNADKAPGTTRLYGVSSLPTDVITTPEGRMVSQVQSPPSVAQYVAQMNQAAAGHRSLARKPERPGVQQAAPPAGPSSQPPVGSGASYGAPYAPAAMPTGAPPQMTQQATLAQNVAGGNDRYAEYFPQQQAQAPTRGTQYGQVTPAQAYSAVPGAAPAASSQTVINPYAAAAQPPAVDPYAGAATPPTSPGGPSAAPATAPPVVVNPYTAAATAPPAATPPAAVNPYAAPAAAPPAAVNPYTAAATAPPAAVNPYAAPAATPPAAGNPYIGSPAPAPAQPPAAAPYAAAPPMVQAPAAAMGPPPYQSQPPPGATASQPPNLPQLPPGCPPIGLDGNCPVTLVERKRWVVGTAAYGVVHRGRTYLFLGPQEKEKFLADPDRFSPVLSGVDPVLALDSRMSVPGRREFGVFGADGRVYLFADEKSRARFEANEQAYAQRAQQATRTQYQAQRPGP